MPILYATPFVLLSILSFSACAAVPNLRRFALSALVAPVVFGVSSLSGWIAFALAGDALFKESFGAMFSARLPMLIAGLLCYALPGLLGAGIAIFVVRSVEKRFLRTEYARNIALRMEITAVTFPCGFVITLVVIDGWFHWPSAWSFMLLLTGAFLGGAILSTCIYVATRGIGKSRDLRAVR
jgi:hypothetical protein